MTNTREDRDARRMRDRREFLRFLAGSPYIAALGGVSAAAFPAPGMRDHISIRAIRTRSGKPGQCADRAAAPVDAPCGPRPAADRCHHRHHQAELRSNLNTTRHNFTRLIISLLQTVISGSSSSA